MAPQIVECVPNFSEGRDLVRLEKILDAIRAVSGAELIDVDAGHETNRTVVTIVGEPEAVKEAAFRAIERAAQVIDMSKHHGAHARHGATDVCPFVPVSGVTMEDCARFARELGERVGEELGIPVYLYDRAALKPERRSLADVRRGEYEALSDKLSKPEWAPDFGPAEFLPKTGVVTIGAREFLIAYNINLNTRYKEDATDIAFDLRDAGRIARGKPKTHRAMSGKILRYEPSRRRFPCPYDFSVHESLDALAAHYREAHDLDLQAELAFFGQNPEKLERAEVHQRGLFKECRAVGWLIPEYGRAQISINLTDYKVTSMHDVLEASRRIGAERGIVVTGSEVVGVVPFAAMKATGEFYLQEQHSSRGVPVGDVIETAIQSLGLRDIGEFDAKKSVLGMPTVDGALANMKVTEFVDEVSRPSVAPGGGSISALAGSLAAALTSMVANITHVKPKFHEVHDKMERIAMRCQELKDELVAGIDADTDAFNDVITAMRMPQGTATQKKARRAAIQEGYKKATLVPVRTAESCLEALRQCRAAVGDCLRASITDVGVGALMARSAVVGAVYNVRINLGEIDDSAWVDEVRSKLDALLDEADELAHEVDALVRAAF
ncbi:MAG: glutamate formimidoyltransferase [Planctomycetes bacterium]|nr:glutamate formimidoyltransferase [Planctomycetota bacterium]